VARKLYEIGVPEEGFYEEILNTDSELFGGSNLGNGGIVSSRPIPKHNRPFSIAVTLPPLSVVLFRKR
jgi:1,4-alpha-glucan branching enzyme